MFYKAQVRPYLDYDFHIWAGIPQCEIQLFDSIQRRAIRIVNDPKLTDGLGTLSTR